jgi:small GTP-binding protein
MGNQISVDSQIAATRTIALVGLDGSGKSSIAFQMVTSHSSEEYVPVPTSGVSFLQASIGGQTFRIYDCGGFGRYRIDWPYYIEQSDAVAFVIDRTDKERMGRVREEIAMVIAKCRRLSIPLLVLVNKTDIASKLTVADFTKITLINESQITYAIKECCGKTGNGVATARDWLLEKIKPRSATLPVKVLN